MILDKFIGVFSNDMAIDLGTANTIVSVKDKGIIIKTGNKYKTIDGLDLCENSQIATFENTISYLENPKHQDVRMLIEAKLLNK